MKPFDVEELKEQEYQESLRNYGKRFRTKLG